MRLRGELQRLTVLDASHQGGVFLSNTGTSAAFADCLNVPTKVHSPVFVGPLLG